MHLVRIMNPTSAPQSLIRSHTIWSWGSLAFFMALGLVLELLHAIKWGGLPGSRLPNAADSMDAFTYPRNTDRLDPIWICF